MDKVQIGCEISPINVSQMFNLPMIHIIIHPEKRFCTFFIIWRYVFAAKYKD
jgi:hypothetical protein